MPSPKPVRLVFDVEQLRPMCVLIQAMYTDDYQKVDHFNSESWLIAPTDKMMLVELTPKKFEMVVKTMNARFPMRQLRRKTG
jgi:hypothetical protein